MDVTDNQIKFDEVGFCNHCRRAEKLISAAQLNSDFRLEKWVETISQRSKNLGTNSIIGLSGGVDSSYVALLLSRLQIKPLVIHVDAGWNNEVAVTNIRKLVDSLGLELKTIVIDWKKMRALQTAFLRAGIRNQDIPQDHAYFASLYSLATKYRIRNIITGANIATESILPSSWGSDAMDGRFLRAVAKSQGLTDLGSFPVSRLPRHYLARMAVGRLVIHKPLDRINYNKAEAMIELAKFCGWRDYGGKHRESLFTTWFQHVYLVRRFGIDKRKAHLSSLIMSGQISRNAALEMLAQPALNSVEEKLLTQTVARKLLLSTDELENLIELPGINDYIFPNDQWIYSSGFTKIGRVLISSQNQVLSNIDIAR